MKSVKFCLIATCKGYDDCAEKAMLLSNVFSYKSGFKIGYTSMIRKKKLINNCLFVEISDVYKDETEFKGKFERIKEEFTRRGISLMKTYALKSDEDKEFLEAKLDSEPELEQIADLCRSKIDLSEFEAFIAEYNENTLKLRELKIFIPSKKLESAVILTGKVREIAK